MMPSRRIFITGLGALVLGAICSIPSRIRNNAEISQPTAQRKPPALNATPSAVNPAEAKPAGERVLVIIPRSEWGAEEPNVTPDGMGEHGPYDPINNPSGWMVYDQPLETVLYRFIIHHSALPLSDGPREIQRLHTEEKGFADIGYHFLIDEKGRIFEGRALNVRGAHTYGANEGSLGICLLGNFEEIQPTPEQLNILGLLLNGLIARYPRISQMAGHRDYNPGITLCPGANLYALLPDLAKNANINYRI